jgi:hypothetical protein
MESSVWRFVIMNSMGFLEVLAAVAAIVVPLVGLQTFWIARSLDGLESSIGRRLDRIEARFDRLELLAERVARLEAG